MPGNTSPKRSTPLPNPPPQGGRERERVLTLTSREAPPVHTLSFAILCIVANVSSALAQTTFTPRDESPEEFAAGSGRDETFYACTACHNFKLVAAQGLSRAGWEDSINLMIRRHNMPPLDGKDREVVLNYLEAAYPPRAPAAGRWQNPFSKQ